MRILPAVHKLVYWGVVFAVVYGLSSGKIEEHNRWYYEEVVGKIEKVDGEITSMNLVIGHPDDEVMFFSPTMVWMDELVDKNTVVRVISMTNGDGDGDGHVRQEELKRSLRILVHSRDVESHVLEFEDSKSASWDMDAAQKRLREFVWDERPLVVTFDRGGVSGHVNHISCGEVVSSMGFERVYYLKSGEGMHVKYSGFIPLLWQVIVGPIIGQERPRLFMCTLRQYLLALSAMSVGHVSQMVWFRVGWWMFSRLCFGNELVENFS